MKTVCETILTVPVPGRPPNKLSLLPEPKAAEVAAYAEQHSLSHDDARTRLCDSVKEKNDERKHKYEEAQSCIHGEHLCYHMQLSCVHESLLPLLSATELSVLVELRDTHPYPHTICVRTIKATTRVTSFVHFMNEYNVRSC